MANTLTVNPQTTYAGQYGYAASTSDEAGSNSITNISQLEKALDKHKIKTLQVTRKDNGLFSVEYIANGGQHGKIIVMTDRNLEKLEDRASNDGVEVVFVESSGMLSDIWDLTKAIVPALIELGGLLAAPLIGVRYYNKWNYYSQLKTRANSDPNKVNVPSEFELHDIRQKLVGVPELYFLADQAQQYISEFAQTGRYRVGRAGAPFGAIITGVTGTGKTTLISNIIKKILQVDKSSIAIDIAEGDMTISSLLFGLSPQQKADLMVSYIKRAQAANGKTPRRVILYCDDPEKLGESGFNGSVKTAAMMFDKLAKENIEVNIFVASNSGFGGWQREIADAIRTRVPVHDIRLDAGTARECFREFLHRRYSEPPDEQLIDEFMSLHKALGFKEPDGFADGISPQLIRDIIDMQKFSSQTELLEQLQLKESAYRNNLVSFVKGRITLPDKKQFMLTQL